MNSDKPEALEAAMREIVTRVGTNEPAVGVMALAILLAVMLVVAMF